ncbi:zinc finger protein ush isoform X2 [Tetranychus urticae]|nr:zinc finger protein ush isoform X2 [Tetranychus urticae]
MNLDECNSSSSSSSTTSSSSSRSSSPQPTTIVNSIEEESGRAIISEDSPNNSSNHHLQTPLSPIREESFSQEANLESTPMITPQSHKQSSSSPPPPTLLLPQSPSHMSTEQTSTDPLTNEQTALPSSPSTSSSMPQDSRASSSPQHSHSPSLCVASNVDVNNATSIEENVADGTMEPPPTLPSTSSKQPLQSCIVRKRKVSTTDSMMAATATEKSPTTTSSSSPTILPSSDQFVKPLTTESGNIASTITSSSTTLKDTLSLISKPNIDEKIIKDLNQSSLINSLILNSRTPGLIMPPQKPVPPPPPLSLASVSPTSLPSNSSSSQQKTQQQPIYVAISTNPLILVPLSYNTETGGLDLSINNPVGNVKLPEDILSSAQLNDPLAFERAALLGNSLEAHRNNNRNNPINGLFDSTNIINVNSLTNNNIISINNNTSDSKSIIDTRNTILNNINTDCPQISRRPQSTEGPLDLSSNQSGDHHQEKPAFRHHYRHENEFSSNLSTSATTLASYKVKSEANLTMEESESPAPLNLFNSSSNFTSLASSSRDIPQSTSSVIAAAAAVAAAAAQASPSSGGATLPVPAASLPSPFAPEGVFKQSSYHCEHCHIGFYKKENYTIHKRHYCSARRTQAVAAAVAAAAAGGSRSGSGNNARTGSESSPDMLESEGSPNSSPEISLDSVKAERHSRLPNVNSHRGSSRRVSVSSKTNASNSSNSPGSSPPHQPLSQYYCVACGIRFTSLDNLQAHQTYYCLKRNSVNSSPDKLQYIVSIPGGSGSEVSCVKCKATYCNEEAFLSHVCSAMNLGAISSSSIPNITPNGSKSLTGSASSPNFNTNGNDGRCFSAGSGQSETDQQCFRCTICGYKGQTLQGMRIHVRMHSQCFRCTICGYKGHTLRGMRTHVRIHQDKIQGLPEETFIACIEDEALVAKSNRNGPSGPKRRRKSLEVFGAHSNVPHLYGFSSSVSENSKPSQLIGGLMPSFSLATSAPTTTSTASGVLSVSLGSNNIGTMSSNDVNLSVNNNVNNLNSSHSEISSENDDEAASNISENETSGREDSRQGGSGESLHNCQFCYYSSTYKGNVVRHVKLVHKDVSRNGPSPTASFSGLSKREINEDATGGDSMGSINDDLPLDLKSNRSNGLNGKLNRTGSPNNSEGSPVDQNVGNNGSINNNNLIRNNNSNSNGANNNSNASAQAKKAVPKYCRSCDISFQFLTSFIAHKKYYCSSHSNETNVIQSLPESKSPV